MNVNESTASQDIFTQNTSIQSNVDETFKTPKQTASAVSLKTNKKQKINNSLDNAVEALKFACSQKSAVSEFNIFGQHIATQLEKLPIKIALQLQTNIQNMITSARLDMDDMHDIITFDNNNTTSSTSGTSENSQDMFGQSDQDQALESDDESVIALYYNNWEKNNI